MALDEATSACVYPPREEDVVRPCPGLQPHPCQQELWRTERGLRRAHLHVQNPAGRHSKIAGNGVKNAPIHCNLFATCRRSLWSGPGVHARDNPVPRPRPIELPLIRRRQRLQVYFELLQLLCISQGCSEHRPILCPGWVHPEDGQQVPCGGATAWKTLRLHSKFYQWTIPFLKRPLTCRIPPACQKRPWT